MIFKAIDPDINFKFFFSYLFWTKKKIRFVVKIYGIWKLKCHQLLHAFHWFVRRQRHLKFAGVQLQRLKLIYWKYRKSISHLNHNQFLSLQSRKNNINRSMRPHLRLASMKVILILNLYIWEFEEKKNKTKKYTLHSKPHKFHTYWTHYAHLWCYFKLSHLLCFKSH